jgi:hypothetical protein
MRRSGDYEKFSPAEMRRKLRSAILDNTEFKRFSIDGFPLDYPDWRKVETDPQQIWPEEVASKERVLLYLANSDGMKILVTKKKLSPSELGKPYPLILREAFAREKKVMEEKGGLTDFRVVREDFFDNGIIMEFRSTLFGTAVTSISKSVVLRRGSTGFIYSVGISGSEGVFEDYRPLADYVLNSTTY